MLDQVKAHVGKHKVAYSLGSVIVIAGVAYYIGVRNGSPRMLSNSIFGINCKLDQSVITLVDRSGPPSWIIERIDTGERWLSQRACAIAEGLLEENLSKHLNGLTEHAGGHVYRRLGLAA